MTLYDTLSRLVEISKRTRCISDRLSVVTCGKREEHTFEEPCDLQMKLENEIISIEYDLSYIEGTIIGLLGEEGKTK